MNQVSIKCLKSDKIESGACYGQFVINPLKKGQGITIGNLLRRVLLGDLEGTVISAVRIAGVKHEFSTIPGIREDVLEILLNLKNVVLKRKTQIIEGQIGRLKINGPGVVTADLIQLPSTLEIVDPNHYIATISTSDLFEMEFKFESGTGYRLALEKDFSPEDGDYLQLDCVFMPVQKVNFKVEYIYDSFKNFSERLFLDIWTNGSISPKDALKSANQTIIELFTFSMNDEDNNENIKEDSESILKTESISIEPYTNITIEELELSVRSYNCLKKAQLNTIGDLLQYPPGRLNELKNFGRKSEAEVFSALEKRFGLKLK